MIDYTFSIAELEYFLVVMVRITGFVFIVPFFNMGNTPKRFRVALSIFLAYLVYQTSLPHEVLAYGTVLEYAIIIMKEAVTGILIGFSAYICNTIVLFAGRLVDMEVGLSMANAIDPTTKEQATFRIMLPAAKSGILAGTVLAIGRAVGETMAVIMVIGGSPEMPKSLFQSVRTLTANIAMGAMELSGDSLSALIATGVVLFVFALVLNVSFAAMKRDKTEKDGKRDGK